MEKIKVSKFDITLDNFINRYGVSGIFSKSEFLELLSRATLSEDRDLRRVACKIIRRLKIRELMPYIRILLNDEDPVIKSLSLLTVAQLKDVNSYKKVLDLYNSESKMVKASSLLALGSLDNPESYDLIYKSLEDDSDEVRENAVIATSWISSSDSAQKLINLYEIEKNKNIKTRIIKALSLIPSSITVEKLENIVINEQDDILILTAINTLYKKSITKYNILAYTILLKIINDNLKINKAVENYRKKLYTIVSNNFWEVKNINEIDQKNIFKFIEEDLIYKYYIRSEEIKKMAISSLKNLNQYYHQMIIKIIDNDLPSSIKIEIINFLNSSKIDKNLKLLLLEFLSDDDKIIREQALFAILDNSFIKTMISYINEKIFSLDYTYLKLIALAIIYNSI